MPVEFEDSQANYESGASASASAPANAPEARPVYEELNTPRLVAWIVKKGIIKDEKAASYLLFGLAILFFAASAAIFYEYIVKPANPTPTVTRTLKVLSNPSQ